MQKVADMLNRGSYMAVEVKGKEGKKKYYRIFRLKDIKRKATYDRKVDIPPATFTYTGGSDVLRRMEANKCEYCGKVGGYFEQHHIRKLADIKDGKKPWEKFMIQRQRLTLTLCIECHDRLHAGTLPDRRHFLK